MTTAPSCPGCSAPLPDDARYCAYCGREAAPLPRAETFHLAEPRYFGVPASGALLTVGAGCLVLAVLLLAFGYVVSGVLLLVAAFAFLGLFASAVPRRRDGALARRAHRLAVALRASAGYAAQHLAVRGATRVALARAERERAELRAERDGCLRELGEAVLGGDAELVDRVRARIEELDRRLEDKDAETRDLVAHLHERLERARRESQATEIQPQPPAPPQIPEPSPEPHRPPVPPDTPEPSPEPHRPPAPPQVPEPTPEPSLRG